MNRLERKAALAVATAAVGVVVSGVSLLKKHSKYMTQKAAATFDPQEEEDWFDEAEAAGGEEAGEAQEEKAGKAKEAAAKTQPAEAGEAVEESQEADAGKAKEPAAKEPKSVVPGAEEEDKS